jgi:hypothetical protein
MNRFDRHIIRYDEQTQQWYDDGLRLAPGTTAANQFNNLTTEALLAEAGQTRLNEVAIVRGAAMQPSWSTVPDKATIVNQRDAKRMMYDLDTETWSEVPNNDAIYHVHDRTHYADLLDSAGNPLTLAQLRCAVQSIMNTEKPSVAGEPVAMPEMQLFGLPADPINTGNVATITYLKAEDAAGKLHDMLGKHMSLPYRQIYSYYYSIYTSYRFYIGTPQNIATTGTHANRLYLSIQNTSGQMATTSVTVTDSHPSLPYRDMTLLGNYATDSAYFEIYIFSEKNEKIILASGYING